MKYVIRDLWFGKPLHYYTARTKQRWSAERTKAKKYASKELAERAAFLLVVQLPRLTGMIGVFSL